MTAALHMVAARPRGQPPVSYVKNAEYTGAGATSVTITNVNTTGPVSVFLVSTRHGSNSTNLVSATLNGSPCALLVTTSGQRHCAAIVLFNGAATNATLVLTFINSVSTTGVTAVSLTGLQSLTPINVQGAASGSSVTSISLPAITGPGANGIVLCVEASYDDDTTTINWTNATKISDFACGTAGRASAAVVLGNPAGTITAALASGNDYMAIAGASLR